MKYSQHETRLEVTLSPSAPAVGAVILLHGLGADGWDFAPIVSALELPDDLPLRFVFPHAPVRPVTVNNGYEMRAWYDVRAFTPEDRADAAGLAEAAARVSEYIRAEEAGGTPAARVVLAGFSQGGAVALHAGLRYRQQLAGILALSTYLPFPSTLAAEKSAANSAVPILLCHGTQDPVVPCRMGEESRDLLRSMGYEVEWRAYPMQHEVDADELDEVSRWLCNRFA